MKNHSFIKSVEPTTDVVDATNSGSGQSSGGCGQSCGTSSGGGNCAQSTGHSQKVTRS